MKEPVLKAVCKPPEIFKAPFNLFFVNFIINFIFMLLGIVLAQMFPHPITEFIGFPLLWMIVMLVGHVILAGLYAKDQHIATMVMAYGTTPKGTKNQVKHKGDKFSP